MGALSKLKQWNSLVLDVAPSLGELLGGPDTPSHTGKRRTAHSANNRKRRLLQDEFNYYDSSGYYYYEYPDDYDSGGSYGDSYGGYYEYDESDFMDLEVKPLTADLLQVAVFSDGTSKQDSVPFLGVYHMQSADAVVIKLNTFLPEAGAWSAARASGPFMKSLYLAFREADTYADNVGADQLIIDVSANGGGDPTAIFFLIRLVQNDWTRWEDLCDVSNLKVSDLGEFLHKAGDLPRLEPLLEGLRTAPEDQVEQAGQLIVEIMAAIEAVVANVADQLMYQGPPLEFDTSALQAKLSSPSLSISQKRAALITFLTDDVREQSESAFPDIDGTGKYSLKTNMEFEGTDWYAQDRLEAVRGGALVNYTQFFYAFCPEALKAFTHISENSKGVVHRFKKVVLVSDGTCGSACSTFATRLMLSGGVRSLTYGGHGNTDEAMDSSAFGGGNVLPWAVHAKGTVLAYFVSLLLGHTPRPIYDMDITDVPIPFPTAATARFTVDATYEPYLGPKSLPREFYSIPADVHAAFWIQNPGSLPVAGEDGRPINLDILQAWQAASLEFPQAPLLDDWTKKDWDYSSYEPSRQVRRRAP